jgi:hypothetical protein
MMPRFLRDTGMTQASSGQRARINFVPTPFIESERLGSTIALAVIAKRKPNSDRNSRNGCPERPIGNHSLSLSSVNQAEGRASRERRRARALA